MPEDYTDFEKGNSTNTIAFLPTHQITDDATGDPATGVTLDASAYTLSYRIAGGLRNSSTELPVDGAANPNQNAISMAKLINQHTVCQVNAIRAQLYQSDDVDVPARPVGSYPTKTLRYRVFSEDGLQQKDVEVRIPFFKGGDNTTLGAANLGKQLRPFIRVFGPNDVVHLLG